MAFLPLETGRRSHGTRVRVNQRAAAAPVSVSVTIIANRSPQPSHAQYKWRNSQFLLFSKCHTLMKRVGKSERGEIAENTISPDKYFTLLSDRPDWGILGGSCQPRYVGQLITQYMRRASPGRNGWRLGARRSRILSPGC